MEVELDTNNGSDTERHLSTAFYPLRQDSIPDLTLTFTIHPPHCNTLHPHVYVRTYFGRS